MNNSKEIAEEKQGTAFIFPSENGAFQGTVYIESYGCAMNFSDSEIVASILQKEGFKTISEVEKADLVLLNTCSIREKAEQTVRNRLTFFQGLKKRKPNLMIGVLGCMAERLKDQLLEQEKIVDLVVGPDAYRDLPVLLKKVENGQKGINVLLSREETYAEISPLRLDANGVTAFISIMRGCDNMCSFCVVPFTRGRERSRDVESILHEARYLASQGYKEITLLGQNVDSYKYKKENSDQIVSFAVLLALVAEAVPTIRIRFSTSHPKDMTDEVLQTMAHYPNICKYIHLPVQSGSSAILEKMNRGYTADWYKERIDKIRHYMPDCGISTDIIAGFCTETIEDHQQTLAMMNYVGYDFAYMFKYSERPNTLAQRKYKDDVSEEEKSLRLAEIVGLQRSFSHLSAQKEIGKIVEVLIEGISKKSDQEVFGRTSQNKTVVFKPLHYKKGDLVKVKIENCTPGTLLGKIID